MSSLNVYFHDIYHGALYIIDNKCLFDECLKNLPRVRKESTF